MCFTNDERGGAESFLGLGGDGGSCIMLFLGWLLTYMVVSGVNKLRGQQRDCTVVDLQWINAINLPQSVPKV
jgi:hypothetical protein